MANKILTQRGVETARPRAKRYGVRDQLIPGLRLIVQPSGARSYALFARSNGRLLNLKVGNAALISLAAAREEARRQLALTSRGEDPHYPAGDRGGVGRDRRAAVHRALRPGRHQKLAPDRAAHRARSRLALAASADRRHQQAGRRRVARRDRRPRLSGDRQPRPGRTAQAARLVRRSQPAGRLTDRSHQDAGTGGGPRPRAQRPRARAGVAGRRQARLSVRDIYSDLDPDRPAPRRGRRLTLGGTRARASDLVAAAGAGQERRRSDPAGADRARHPRRNAARRRQRLRVHDRGHEPDRRLLGGQAQS